MTEEFGLTQKHIKKKIASIHPGDTVLVPAELAGELSGGKDVKAVVKKISTYMIHFETEAGTGFSLGNFDCMGLKVIRHAEHSRYSAQTAMQDMINALSGTGIPDRGDSGKEADTDEVPDMREENKKE